MLLDRSHVISAVTPQLLAAAGPRLCCVGGKAGVAGMAAAGEATCVVPECGAARALAKKLAPGFQLRAPLGRRLEQELVVHVVHAELLALQEVAQRPDGLDVTCEVFSTPCATTCGLGRAGRGKKETKWYQAAWGRLSSHFSAAIQFGRCTAMGETPASQLQLGMQECDILQATS